MLCFRLLHAIVLSSDVFDASARARVCLCVVHWHCTAQLSMFNMEKRLRNKIIIIIIIIIKADCAKRYFLADGLSLMLDLWVRCSSVWQIPLCL